MSTIIQTIKEKAKSVFFTTSKEKEALTGANKTIILFFRTILLCLCVFIVGVYNDCILTPIEQLTFAQSMTHFIVIAVVLSALLNSCIRDGKVNPLMLSPFRKKYMDTHGKMLMWWLFIPVWLPIYVTFIILQYAVFVVDLTMVLIGSALGYCLYELPEEMRHYLRDTRVGEWWVKRV